MLLELKRFSKERTRTLGNLYINGKFVCNTLEEADRSFPPICNCSFFTHRRFSSVCTHVINRGESCAIQGTFDLMYKKHPKHQRELLALIGEPHHKYNKIYLTGVKRLNKQVFSLIQTGFYNKETKEFIVNYKVCYEMERRIKNAIRREEDVKIRINYNDA